MALLCENHNPVTLNHHKYMYFSLLRGCKHFFLFFICFIYYIFLCKKYKIVMFQQIYLLQNHDNSYFCFKWCGIIKLLSGNICPLKRWQASYIRICSRKQCWPYRYVDPETRGQYEREKQTFTFKAMCPFKSVTVFNLVTLISIQKTIKNKWLADYHQTC